MADDLHEIEYVHPGGFAYNGAVKVDGQLQIVESISIDSGDGTGYPTVTLVYQMPAINGTWKRMKVVYEGEADANG